MAQMTSNVYFFQHNTLPLVKIGKANDWAIRALQVGGVELIDFERSMFKEVADSTTAYDLERMLHVLFEDRSVPDPTGLSGGTEWFCETIMGEVCKAVRGLMTCSGFVVTKGSKLRRVRNDPKTMRREMMRRARQCEVRYGNVVIPNIWSMSLSDLKQEIVTECTWEWLSHDLHIWPDSRLSRDCVHNIIDHTLRLTSATSGVPPRLYGEPWRVIGNLNFYNEMRKEEPDRFGNWYTDGR
jgi:hypothetical protein